MVNSVEGFEIGKTVAPVDAASALFSGSETYPMAVIVNLNPIQLMSVEGDMFWSSSAKHKSLYLLKPKEKEFLPDAVVARMQREGLVVPEFAVNPTPLKEWSYQVTIESGDVKHVGCGTVMARTEKSAMYKVKTLFPYSAKISLTEH